MIAAALLAVALAAAPPGAAAQLESANAAYLAGDAAAAARSYAELLARGHESAALHVNLGNALWRAGQRGRAIASYRRALRLDPRDGDARSHLELARGANVDRLVGEPGRPFLARVAERTPDGTAAAAFALPWAALWTALALRTRAGRRRRAPLGAAAAAAALLAGAGGLLLAARVEERQREVAVVVAPVSPVRDGPEAALRPAFELHEGTAVHVLEVRGEAVRVRLDNGLEGWVRARDVERV
jgi:hypothetical protein